MKKTCHDCLWRDFTVASGMCHHPERRHHGSGCCEYWEWRYE